MAYTGNFVPWKARPDPVLIASLAHPTYRGMSGLALSGSLNLVFASVTEIEFSTEIDVY